MCLEPRSSDAGWIWDDGSGAGFNDADGAICLRAAPGVGSCAAATATGDSVFWLSRRNLGRVAGTGSGPVQECNGDKVLRERGGRQDGGEQRPIWNSRSEIGVFGWAVQKASETGQEAQNSWRLIASFLSLF